MYYECINYTFIIISSEKLIKQKTKLNLLIKDFISCYKNPQSHEHFYHLRLINVLTSESSMKINLGWRKKKSPSQSEIRKRSTRKIRFPTRLEVRSGKFAHGTLIYGAQRNCRRRQRSRARNYVSWLVSGVGINKGRRFSKGGR